MSTVVRQKALTPSHATEPLVTRQDSTDKHLVDLWLHGRPPHTQRAYRPDVDCFLAFGAAPLTAVTLGDVQAFADWLTGLAPSSRARTLAAIKSLLSFGQRTGYLALNVGAAVKLPARKDTLAERILSEADVHAMLALERGAPFHLVHASGPASPNCGSVGRRGASQRGKLRLPWRR